MREILPKRLVIFGKTSLIGLTADVAVFSLLSQQMAVFSAALIGSFVGMSVTHFLSAKPVFRSSVNAWTWCLSLVLATISTVGFSFGIDLISRELNLIPIVAKLTTVPLSFCVNYIGNKLIFRAGAKT